MKRIAKHYTCTINIITLKKTAFQSSQLGQQICNSLLQFTAGHTTLVH